MRFRYPEAVVATRRKAETEALAVLENAHVDSAAIELPEAAASRRIAGEW